jgi:chromosome partitioning protein
MRVLYQVITRARYEGYMQTFAFISQKGGSGKTTLALHFAVEAAWKGLKTLLLDLDPQGSASHWADRRKTDGPDIDVLSLQSHRLASALGTASAQGYRLIVIDTAPNADRTAIEAAKASDMVLVPCRPSILDLDAISATLDCCRLANRTAQVVLNAAPIRSRVVDESRAAVRKLGGIVCDLVVHERVAFRHALIDGRVAQEYQPESPAAGEIRSLYSVIAGKHAPTKTRAHDARIA